MLRLNTRFLALIAVSVLVPGAMSGCDPAPEPEPAVVAPGPAATTATDVRPSIPDAQAAVLAIAREEYPTMPIESATAYAIGRDAQGIWWVQAWTTASPEFEGEQGEQWFVTFDGETWTLVSYGTGLGTDDFPEVAEWEQLQ